MSHHLEKSAARARTCEPVCPACGELECLCRPRFFPGQLLTDEDLNRLERYILEKNKLHNRYLHGWGVVCGLEVSCNPCEGFVTVRSGYALSPCGDDIAVCRDEAVDLCELLRRCREEMYRHWECEPQAPRPQPDCDQDQPWVLYVCYQEKPSRGITALHGSSGGACCSRCSGGGSSDCGCGCHEKPAHRTRSGGASRPAKAPPQCEPTITCEGYTFQLRKAPKPTREVNLGKMIGRITECVRELASLRNAMNALPANPPLRDVEAVREDLVTFLERHGISKCDLFRAALQPLPPLPQVPAGGITAHFDPMLRAALQECVCGALLPPCPEPVDDNCVPLATVTVNCKEGCRIVQVCNWGPRRMVPTVPAFEYWLEPYLRKSGVVESIARFCCGADEHDREIFDNLLAAAGPGVPAPSAPASVFNEIRKLFKSFFKNLF